VCAGTDRGSANRVVDRSVGGRPRGCEPNRSRCRTQRKSRGPRPVGNGGGHSLPPGRRLGTRKRRELRREMRTGSKGALLVVCIFVVFIAFNFFFFVDSRQSTETEENGDRSSYHSTPYGTLAYYTLLEQNGIEVSRLERPLTTLKPGADTGTLLVIAPPLKYNPSQEEFNSLNSWVESGGLLILIDREIKITMGGDLEVETARADIGSNVRPLQPTRYTQGVRRLSVSRFASHLKVTSPSVTYHIGDNQGPIVADARAGRGRIILVGDPFIVANNGIAEEDNLALAMNILEERPPGRVTFDEYHHGYGNQHLIGSGGLIGYFGGTPVPWMMAQAILIATLLI